MKTLDIDLNEIHWQDWRDDPSPLYRVLRDERPVFYDEPHDVYLLTRYEDVDVALKDHERFSSTPLLMVDGDRISPLRQEDPPRHTFLRRIVMPLFTPKEMRRLDSYFVNVARELLDRAETKDVIEVSSELAIPLPGRVTCDLLGVPLDEHARFLELTAERLALLHLADGRFADDGGRRPLAEIQDDLWGIVGPVVQARRKQPQNDAITLLVQAQEQHGSEMISDGLIIDMLLHLLTGGFHTTQHLIESMTCLLIDRPDLWRRLREDRSLVPRAIEEMLRFDSPVQAQRRRVVDEIEMHDTVLPKNAAVAVVLGAANRDDRVFEDPDTYLIDRDTGRHMSFSAGVHYCPGAPVSRFEVRALFEEMLDRYESVTRAGPSERWPQESETVDSMAGYRSVPMRVTRTS